MINRRHRVLPDARLSRHFLTHVTGHWAHIAVRQLIPSFSKGFVQLLRILIEAASDWFIDWIEPQRQIGRCHHRRVTLCWILRVRDNALCLRVGWRPLMRTSGALGQDPIKFEQAFKIFIVPYGWRRRPSTFDAACDRFIALARAKGAQPALALRRDVSAFWFATNMRIWASAMRLTKGMTACDQSDGLFVIHGHPRESLANVAARFHWVWIAIRALWIDIDEAHLNGAQRLCQFAIAAVTLIAQPFSFRAPVNVIFWFPNIFATAAEARRLKAHGFQCAVTCEDHDIGPAQCTAIFFLDRPKQQTGLVEIAIVWPAVERRKALRAAACTTTAIMNAIGASAMPSHADEERTIMTIVSRPPLLRVGHQRKDVGFNRIEIELRKLSSIVEPVTHWIARRRILMKNRKV